MGSAPRIRPKRAPKPPRLRDACDQCHAAKIKCSSEKDGCLRCANQSLPCTYSESKAGKVQGKRVKNRTKEAIDGQPLVDPDVNMEATTNTPAETEPLSRIQWSPEWSVFASASETTTVSSSSWQALVWSPFRQDRQDYGFPSIPLENASRDLNLTSHAQSPKQDQSLVAQELGRFENDASQIYDILQIPSLPSLDSFSDLSPSELIFSDGPSPPLPQSQSMHGPVAESLNVSALGTSHSVQEKSQQGVLARSTNSSAVNAGSSPQILASGSTIDEAQCVRIVCQLIEALQNSITTNLRVLDLLLSVMQRTVDALNNLFSGDAGNNVSVSPQCMCLLYTAMFQVVALARQGRDTLREELGTDRDGGVLRSLDFVGFSNNVSDMQVWRAKKTVDHLVSTTSQVRQILQRVNIIPANDTESTNGQTHLDSIVSSLEQITEECRQMKKVRDAHQLRGL